ncbi:MAG: hypothetical protein NTW50_05340 [Candidatus Berkelbacteria bacterium]|nr:hypothetical protein [Candidatus Berkelbacteria bacterium]
MNCTELTKLINDFSIKLTVYDGVLKTNSVAQIQSVKAEIIEMAAPFEMMLKPINDFFKQYESVIKASESLGTSKNDSFNSFSISPFNKIVNVSNSYIFRRFANKLCDLFRQYDADPETRGQVVTRIMYHFAYCSKDNPIFKIPDDFPDEFYDDFARNFYGSEVSINRAIYGDICTRMRSGRVFIREIIKPESTLSYVGEDATGGYIHIDSATCDLGSGLNGATIIAENLRYGSDLGVAAKSGTIFVKNFERLLPSMDDDDNAVGEFLSSESGATVVVENVLGVKETEIGWNGEQSTVLIKGKAKSLTSNTFMKLPSLNRASAAVYDESLDKFIMISGQKLIDDESHGQFGFFRRSKCGIIETRLEGKGLSEFFAGIEGGIVILKKANIPVIGNDLAGGVIILDDTEGKMFKKKKAEFVVL